VTRRVCLLTGASGRLGTSFCRRYADQYEIVAIYGRNLPAVASQELTWVDPLAPQEPLPENASPVFAVQADLSVDDELRRIVTDTIRQFGKIDVIVNAAVRYALAPMRGYRFATTLAEQFNVNALVPLKLAAIAANCSWCVRVDENVSENRNVVNVSSTSGVYVYANVGQSAYSATKAALNMLTCHMSSEMAEVGVRVNAVAPGNFDEISLDDVADAIVAFDRGLDNGRILVIDREGRFMLD